MTIRVGVDARPLNFLRTGIGQYTLQIINYLAQDSNLKLHLYFNEPPNLPLMEAWQARTPGRKLPSTISAQLLFPLWAKQDDIQVFWSPRHHLPLALRVPTVLTIHDLVWLKAPETMRKLGAVSERVLMPPSIRKASCILCVSVSTKSDLVEFDPEVEQRTRVHYLASRFDGSETMSAPSRHDPFVLHVGTHEPRKNISRLLTSFSQAIKITGSTHKLVLAGNPGWKENIAQKINELRLQDRVLIERDITEVRLAELYRTCEFVAFPSLYEGFGLPLVEAMSFAKPVLTSRISSMPEVAGEAGLYVNPYSVRELTNGLVDLMTKSELRNRLSIAAVNQSKQFDWDRSGEIVRSAIIGVAAD